MRILGRKGMGNKTIYKYVTRLDEVLRITEYQTARVKNGKAWLPLPGTMAGVQMVLESLTTALLSKGSGVL